MRSDLKQRPLQSTIQVREPFVLPDQVEEEAKIKKIEFYKSTYPRLVLFGLFALVTGGILFLLCKWKETLTIKIVGTRCKPHEAKYLIVFGVDGTFEPVKIRNKNLCLTDKVDKYKCFVYRLYTYFYDASDALYKPVQFEIKDKTYEEVVNEFSAGVSSSRVLQERLMTYGKNSTDIERKSNIQILIDETSSPFYLFQLFSIVFWAKWNDYFLYAMIILGVSLFTIAVSFVKTRLSLKKLYERAHYEIEVSVLRFEESGEKSSLIARNISSSNLVPGDIIEIPFNKKMPCDIVLLTGTCIMNESMLTGESIPVIKQHITRSDRIFNVRTADQHILYSGTECLEARRPNKDTPATGFVLRTGFDTMKGRLVRSFIYSKPENFKFYRDSVKYIGAMAVVAIICFLVGIKSYMEQNISAGEYVVHCLEIITCAVPPALPTCLAVGTAMAASRLERKKIVTKTELKINVAGRVKMMCFDKTGTLTRDSLDLFGVRGLSKSECNASKFENIISENIHLTFNASNEKSSSQKMLELMAACHALTYVRGAVSGDPLDLKMFEATRWNLKENESSGAEISLCTLTPPQDATNNGYYKGDSNIDVIKRFEFVAKLQRMSTIIKDPKESRQRVYVKGSPEVLSTLCRPETLPNDFTKTLLIYTQSGLRVIACATRLIEEKVTTHSHVERDTFENNLEFLGFLVFENKLKEVTPAIIRKLKDADIDTMMLTGDNPLTAIFVARDCGIVEKNHKVILGTLVSSQANPEQKEIEWKYIEKTMSNEVATEIPRSQVGIEMVPLAHKQIGESLTSLDGNDIVAQNELEALLRRDKDISIALTGEATNYIASTSEISDAFRKAIFKRGKVFSRMRPDDKAFIIEKLQSQGHIVGMCGDGANDCPALKIANVGIALSEAEASLAAPFMSRITDISSVDIVLREGRTALVTSFQCFKFMSIYALIQTFNIAILNTRVSAMTNGTFLYEDLYVVLPLCLTMGMTRPTEKLSKRRPTENLLSPQVLVAMFGQCIIQLAGQIIGAVIVNKQSWYKNPTELFDEVYPNGTDDEDATVPDWDVTVVFLVAIFQLFSSVMTFSVGKPFRKPFYTNWLFTLCIIYTTASTLILILIPIPALSNLLELRDFKGHESFRWIILAIVLINGLVTYCYDRFGAAAIIYSFKKCFRLDKKRTE